MLPLGHMASKPRDLIPRNVRVSYRLAVKMAQWSRFFPSSQGAIFFGKHPADVLDGLALVGKQRRCATHQEAVPGLDSDRALVVDALGGRLVEEDRILADAVERRLSLVAGLVPADAPVLQTEDAVAGVPVRDLRCFGMNGRCAPAETYPLSNILACMMSRDDPNVGETIQMFTALSK